MFAVCCYFDMGSYCIAQFDLELLGPDDPPDSASWGGHRDTQPLYCSVSLASMGYESHKAWPELADLNEKWESLQTKPAVSILMFSSNITHRASKTL